ncbi:MAG: acetolactate synthase large subunit [Thermoleophilaceae bacterium]|jgi:acetolactate synthase-1/2/3 large subunit|nr:acetolactate synthase large subunit [Thermoleophilaceae bacterium]
MPNGAQALIRTLVNGGVTTCFTNPGTSEMHFVAALDSVPEMRAILALFEGVATGAADGYARMSERPGATLLHLGSGLGNGLANLHNARKGRVPIVNIVGDHATYHTKYDAQLQSDIETVARNFSTWVRTSQSTEALPGDAAEAIAAATGPPGQVATLILPADVSWSEGAEAANVPLPSAPPVASAETLDAVAKALRGRGDAALLLGGRALREPGLVAAARIAAASGAKVYAEVFPTRLERGAGLPPIERIAYLAELASVQLAGIKHLVLVDAKAPVSFFAYPGKKSYLVPDGCEVHELAAFSDDAIGSLEALAETLGATGATPPAQQAIRPAPPTGELTADAVCQAIAAALPEGAIISDESQTSGVTLATHTAGAPRHDLLALTGGAIGQGLPVAVGAAVACPDRPVIALEADGSAMYTIQSLWTMAREGLDVTVVIFNNRSYGILNIELERVGAKAGGPEARAQLDLAGPNLDFVKIANGLGVPSVRVETSEDLMTALQRSIAEPGPHLIETVVPSVYSGFRLRAMPYALRALEKMPRPMAKAAKRRFYP